MYSSHSEAVEQTRQQNLEPSLLIAENHFFRPNILIEAQGFDIDAHFANLRGPIIEVGGPTPTYRVLLNKKAPNEMLISNRFSPEFGRVDFMADARYLPFVDASVGALFSSYLPKNDYLNHGEGFTLRMDFMQEARRTLEPNGLLIMQGPSKDEVSYAMQLGFTPVRIMESEGSLPATGAYERWDCILMNTTSDPGFVYTGEAINPAP